MNREKIEAEIRKSQNPPKISVWWGKNNHKVLRVVLWFIYVPMLICEKITNAKIRNFSEDKSKTKKWLDKVFPKITAHYCDDASCILVVLGYDTAHYGDFCTEDFTNRYAVGRKAEKYFRLLSVQQRKQMIINYEIDGYKKMLLMNWQDWSKAEQKFKWVKNWNKDYDKGVVFYVPDNL